MTKAMKSSIRVTEDGIPNTGRQIHDLGFVRGNKALAEEQDRWASGKVTRGADLHSPYAPRSGVSA